MDLRYLKLIKVQSDKKTNVIKMTFKHKIDNDSRGNFFQNDESRKDVK